MKAAYLLFILFFLTGFAQAKANGLQEFDKATFYSVLKNGSAKEIDNQIAAVNASSLNNKDAFKGALLMKKAGLVDVPAKKLEYFKAGRIKLETIIRDDSTNVEFRFLRLIIQEHAPKIVKYSSQVEEDAAFIRKNYKELSPELQKILIDYSQNSKALKPEDFSI